MKILNNTTMKIIKDYSILASIAIITMLLVACSDDEFTLPNEFSDVFFENSLNRSFTEFGAEVGEAITFADLSQSALSHEWIIGEGASFISKFEDKDTLNLAPFIIPDAGKVSDADRVNVLFQAAGNREVRLRNTFKEEVTYIPPTLRQTRGEDTITSTLENGVWVFDQVFNVTVFDKVQAEFTVSHKGEIIARVAADSNPSASDASQWPVVVLESGDALVFNDISTIGEPSNRSWALNNIVLDEDNKENEIKELEVSYFALGEFTAGEVTVSRFNPLSSGSVTKLIPLNINVVSSTKPFVPVDVGKVVNFTTLKLETTASIKDIGTDFSRFKVDVTNTNQPGFSLEIEVNSVTVDPESSNTLIISLSERIYEDDILTLSYTSDDNITSVDNRVLQTFTNVQVSTNPEVLGNLLDEKYYGFEGGTSQEQHGWFVQHPDVITIGPEKPFSGNNSIKVSNPGMSLSRAVAGEIPEAEGARISVEEGTYDFSMKVWIDPTLAPKGVSLIFRNPFKNIYFDFQGQPTGEWVTITVRVDLPTADPASKINFQVTGNNFGGPGTFFADDISLKLVELRP